MGFLLSTIQSSIIIMTVVVVVVVAAFLVGPLQISAPID